MESLHLFLLLLLLPSITAQQFCHDLLRTQAEASLMHISTHEIVHLFPHAPSLAPTLTTLKRTAPHCTPFQSLHVVLPPHTKALLNNPSLPSMTSVTITPACRILYAGSAAPVYMLSLDGSGLGMENSPPAPFLGIDVLPTVVVELFIRLSCDGEVVEQVLLGGVQVAKLRYIVGRAFLVGKVGA